MKTKSTLSLSLLAMLIQGCVTTPSTDDMCASGQPVVSCEKCKLAAEEYKKGNYRKVEEHAEQKKRCLEGVYNQCKELLQPQGQHRFSEGETCSPPFGLTQDQMANFDFAGVESVDPASLELLQRLLHPNVATGKSTKQN